MLRANNSLGRRQCGQSFAFEVTLTASDDCAVCPRAGALRQAISLTGVLSPIDTDVDGKSAANRIEAGMPETPPSPGIYAPHKTAGMERIQYEIAPILA